MNMHINNNIYIYIGLIGTGGGIQAAFRHLEAMTPIQMFAKQVKTDKDKEQLSLSMVEWMFNDSLDASKEFLEDKHLWSFDIIDGPDGQVQAKAGILREECWALPMFTLLPALELSGEDYITELQVDIEGVDQWLLFKHLCLQHAGEIRLISRGHWEKIAGPPPQGEELLELPVRKK